MRTIFRSIFPVRCLGCGARSLTPLCPQCDVAPTWPRVEVPGLDWVVAPFDYTGAIQALILDFKFSFFLPSGRRIQQVLAPYFKGPIAADLLVPIPGDRHRENERGFRVPEWIWQDLLPMPPVSIVQRVRKTAALHGQSRVERIQTLDNAFAVASELLPNRARVMLLDDIVTTGATASAVATQLRNAGAVEVGLLAVAATPLD